MKSTHDELKDLAAMLHQGQVILDRAMLHAARHEILELTERLYTVEWHDRSETPPAGMIWASDGYTIWTLRTFGEPIAKTATAVKFWTAALVPKPPLLELDEGKDA